MAVLAFYFGTVNPISISHNIRVEISSKESMAALIDAISVKRKMFFEFENTPFPMS